MPKKITGFSLDDFIVEGIRELAREDDRTASNYVNRVLLDHIVEKGFEKKPNKEKAKRLRRRKT